MQLTPLIAVHMTSAIGAVILGPFALWARMGSMQRPWLHRAAGYAYVTFMLLAAFTSLFIRDFKLPNLHGFTWIHLLVPVTLTSLWVAFRAIARKDFVTHRITGVDLKHLLEISSLKSGYDQTRTPCFRT